MVDLKCPECSCTIPPDATRCPNCSCRYGDNSVKVPPKSNGNGITLSTVGHATKDEVHGKIFIRASIASVPTRCTFYQCLVALIGIIVTKALVFLVSMQ